MIVYAESSAVLAWLLGEPRGDLALQALAGADFVVASELTLVECDRVLHRAANLDELSAIQVLDCRATLRRVSEHWILLRLSSDIIERARGPFPAEPIRSLDALHLASMLDTVAEIPETSLLTLDQRVRKCGQALGLRLLPDLT